MGKPVANDERVTPLRSRSLLPWTALALGLLVVVFLVGWLLLTDLIPPVGSWDVGEVLFQIITYVMPVLIIADLLVAVLALVWARPKWPAVIALILAVPVAVVVAGSMVP